MKPVSFTLGELAERLGVALHGDPECPVHGISTLANSQPGTISFLSNPRYRKYLADTQAAAIILPEAELANCPVAALLSDNPYLCYARLSALFAPDFVPAEAIHPTAVIDPSASLGEGVRVGAHAVIEAACELADGVMIGAGTVVQQGCRIGRDSRLMANVTVYHGCEIGERAVIHSGAVIGSDGFGFASEQGHWVKIHQLGRVLIGNDVEIGANTSIDRGAIEDTVIGNGVKLDNQIQIAHNVHVGADTAMAGCVGVAGSAMIGERCAIGGGAGILGHLSIADGTTVTAMSLVTNTIKKAGVYASGGLLEEKQAWQKNAVRLKQLDEMARRLKVLEKSLQQLTDKGQNIE